MNAVLAFWIDRDTRTSMVCRSIWKHGCLNMSRCIPCDAMTTKKPHFTIFHAQNQRAVLLRFIWLQSRCIAFTLNDNVFNRHLELFAKMGTWIILKTPCYFLKQACLHNRNLCMIDLMDFFKRVVARRFIEPSYPSLLRVGRSDRCEENHFCFEFGFTVTIKHVYNFPFDHRFQT